METPKTIGNVNLLNLLNATEASVAGIAMIGNINLALVTPETAALLTRIKVGNINATFEVPTGSSPVIHTGQVCINADYFKTTARPVFFLVTGQLIVEPGVPVEALEKGLAGGAVTGQFCCPEGLIGAFSARGFQVMGQTVAYPAFQHVFYTEQVLDAAFLNGLEDGAEVCVLGGVSAPKVLDNALIERKIAKLFVAGDALWHEENAQVLRSRLYRNPGHIKTIPAGFAWVQNMLALDNEMLDYLPGKKLLCKELVQIAADVDAGRFDQAIEALTAQELVLCPAALKPVLAQKCSLFDTKAVFYTDTLWLVRDRQTLHSARLEALSATATLVVTGELSFDEALTPEMIGAKLSKIDNFGLIRCTPAQYEAVRALLAAGEGLLEEIQPTPAESLEAEDPNTIGNVNYLVL